VECGVREREHEGDGELIGEEKLDLLMKRSLMVHDERLDPDLLRDRGKSIYEDLNIDEEGSEKNYQNLVITTLRLRWLPTRMHTSWPRQEG
jgi:hypothetical protein